MVDGGKIISTSYGLIMGRHSGLTEKVKKKIEMLARAGKTDEEMAFILDITRQTFDNWKKQDKNFFASLKGWKLGADDKVERSLYERACGYSHPEDKVFNDNGTPLVVPTIKHYPPDTGACMAWLKNRCPDKWRDKIDHNHDHNGIPENVKVTIVHE